MPPATCYLDRPRPCSRQEERRQWHVVSPLLISVPTNLETNNHRVHSSLFLSLERSLVVFALPRACSLWRVHFNDACGPLSYPSTLEPFVSLNRSEEEDEDDELAIRAAPI